MRVLRSAKLWLFSALAAGSLALPASLSAQAAGQLTGTVTSETGQPLSGASIMVKGSGLGTLTNANGSFSITNVPAGEQTVQASLIGYGTVEKTVTVAAGGTATVEFQLAPAAVELEGIVAVGYGTQKKVNVTGSVAAVESAELEKRPVANVSEALQGAAPGLTVIDRGGRPGDAGTTFFIRGRGSLNSTSPLVLVDGVEGDLNAIDPSDIESISVLKDAASAAIYGSRAANGVILVTTKRGSNTGNVQVSYDGYYGIQDVQTFPEMVGPRSYMELVNEAYVNAGRAPKYSQEYIENTVKAQQGDPSVDPLKYPWNDWLDVLFKPAPIQDHTVSLRGGSDLAAFSLSLNVMDQEGLLPNTAANRYSLRLNTDFNPTEKFSAGVDISVRQSSDVEPENMGGVLWNMFHDMPPTIMAKYPDGSYGWNGGRNPLAYAEAWGTRNRTYQNGRINAKAAYELTDNLTVRTLGSLEAGNWQYESWRNRQQFRNYWNPEQVDREISMNYLDQRKSNDLQTYLQAMLEYDRTFGDHSVTTLLGYDQTTHAWNEIRAGREDFYNNNLREINVGDSSRDWNWGTSNEWALRSGFGRLNYNYQGKYLFEANARYDGSSRFAKGNRFGFFPAFSAGWRISEESFFDVAWVDELKLRGSWGKMGNQDIGLYSFYPRIGLGHNYVFGDALVTGAAKTELANQNISWESTTMTDIGIDASFLQGRLSVAADYYRKDTEDILRRLPIPGLIGLGAPVQNALKVRNTGWEATLGWRDEIDEFNYSANLNLAHNSNEVVDLAGTGPYIGGIWLTQEGYPLGTMYGWEADGLFQTQEEVDAHAQQHPITGPGDIRYVDQNDDGVINNEDKVAIGVDMPKLTLGSNLTAGYKAFDLSLFFQGALGVDYWVNGALVEGPFWENYTTTAWEDRWTPDNPDGRMPKPTYGQVHNHQASSYWVWDASYVKLKNAQFGYTLPESLTERLGTSFLRVYVSGQNLLTFTASDLVLDPEAPSGRGNAYPQTRTVSFGASVQF